MPSQKDFSFRRYGDIVQLEIREVENFASGLFAVLKLDAGMLRLP